jgi:hypothetical protein
MDYNAPTPGYGYTPPPDSAYVEQIDRIEDGLRGYREAHEIDERIAREIGRAAIHGTSQPC